MIAFDEIRDSLRTTAPQVLRCYCCGEPYERGRYLCCRPPNGMPSHEWLSQRCKDCQKCDRHCRCGGRADTGSTSEMRSIGEWLEQARAAIARKSVAEIFAEGEGE